MAYKNIEDRRAYHRKYMKEYRDLLKKQHLCQNCKKQDAYTLMGKIYCYECTCQRLGHAPIVRKKKEREWHEPRAERYLYGKCYLCGQPSYKIEKRWSNGEVRLCEKHYNLILQTAKKRKKILQVPIVSSKKAWENYHRLKAESV